MDSYEHPAFTVLHLAEKQGSYFLEKMEMTHCLSTMEVLSQAQLTWHITTSAYSFWT
jgi:hypothetical protein